MAVIKGAKHFLAPAFSNKAQKPLVQLYVR